MGGLHTALTLQSVLAVIGALLAIVGAWLLRRGRWPARVGTTPHCPSCQYILTGLAANRCPECGTQLGVQNIILGERNLRPVMAVAGAAATLSGLLVLFLGLGGATGRIDLYHYRPAAWLVADLASPNPHLWNRAWTELVRRNAAGTLSSSQQLLWEDRMLNELETSGGPLAYQAWMELRLRSSLGKLSTPYQDRWVTCVIKKQRSPSYSSASNPWQELERLAAIGAFSQRQEDELVRCAVEEEGFKGLGVPMQHVIDLVGSQCRGHVLSPAQEWSFLDGMTSLSLLVRPKIVPGEIVPFRLITAGRGPTGWVQRIRLVDVQIDDQRVKPTGAVVAGLFGTILPAWSDGAVAPQAKGRHRLRIQVAVDVAISPTTYAQLASMSSQHIIRSWDREVAADFDVVEGGAPSTWLSAPDSATLGKYFSATPFQLQKTGPFHIACQINWGYVPVRTAFDVIARIAGEDYPLGTIVPSRGHSFGGATVGLREAPPGPLEKIDVFLRSSESAARMTPDLAEFWWGEITFPDVPVERP